MLQTIETSLDDGLTAVATAPGRYPLTALLGFVVTLLSLLLALAGTCYYGGYQDGQDAAEVTCGS